jgi:hypothetical protein
MEKTVSDKHASTLPHMQPVGPAYDTGRRLSDALLFLLGFPVLGAAWEVWARRGESRFLTMLALGLALCGALFLSGRVVIRAGLDTLERITRTDLNHDGAIAGERPIQVNRAPVETGVELWERFVKQAVHKSDERSLLRQGFDDKQIGLGRDALIRWGLAAWRSTDRRHGWDIKEGVDAAAILAAIPYCDLLDDDEAA